MAGAGNFAAQAEDVRGNANAKAMPLQPNAPCDDGSEAMGQDELEPTSSSSSRSASPKMNAVPRPLDFQQSCELGRLMETAVSTAIHEEPAAIQTRAQPRIPANNRPSLAGPQPLIAPSKCLMMGRRQMGPIAPRTRLQNRPGGPSKSDVSEADLGERLEDQDELASFGLSMIRSIFEQT